MFQREIKVFNCHSLSYNNFSTNNRIHTRRTAPTRLKNTLTMFLWLVTLTFNLLTPK